MLRKVKLAIRAFDNLIYELGEYNFNSGASQFIAEIVISDNTAPSPALIPYMMVYSNDPSIVNKLQNIANLNIRAKKVDKTSLTDDSFLFHEKNIFAMLQHCYNY